MTKVMAIERAKYLLESLERVHDLLIDQTKEHAETCMITGKATSMCLAHFSDLDRICNEVIKSIQLINEKELKDNNINIPPPINLDGSIRQKNDSFDYGLNEYEAETEYHKWLEDLKDASNYSPPKRKYRGA